MNVFDMKPECEIRFDVIDEIKIELIDGEAEFFGTELLKNKVYTFKPSLKGAIFTYSGCKLLVQNEKSFIHVSSFTPMVFYKNIHFFLDKMRKDSYFKNCYGPIVLICGQKNVGKSTLSKVLLNYAIKTGNKPIYVDLDCGQGSIGLPGTIGYLIMEKFLEIETSYNSFNSFKLHYGYKDPSSNCNLFLALITQLSQLVLNELKRDLLIKKSGIIINTCGWITGFGYRSLEYAIKKFRANVVLTINEEGLNNFLKQRLRYSKIINLPKSDGVVQENNILRYKNRDRRIHDYFYDSDFNIDNQLSTTSFDILFDQLNLYQIIDKKKEISLPYYKYNDINSFKLEKINPSIHLLNHLLVITQTTDVQQIFNSDMKDYCLIKNVDIEKEIITLVLPKLQVLDLKSIFVLSQIKFLEKNYQDNSNNLTEK